MSCPNFVTQSWFPLFVIDDDKYRYRMCDECGETVEEDFEEDECPYCGGELSDVKFDNDGKCFDFEDIQNELDEENKNLSFFRIRIEDGYFADSQFVVYLTDNADCCGFDIDGDVENVDNEETKYYFDCCRSKCIRKFNSEHGKVLKIMKRIAEEWNMEQLSCVGVFSNGEAVYGKVG